MRFSQALVLLFSVLAVQNQHLCVAQSVGQHVLLHDPTGHTLRSSTASVSPAAAAAALCSATGLVPPVKVHGDSAATVEGLLQPQSVLGQAPKAVLLLHLSGINPGSSSLAKLREAWGEGSTVRLDLQDSTHDNTAGSLLQAASDIVAVNPDATVTVLDHSALQGCSGGHCLQHHLHQAMHHCGGKVHPKGPAQQHSPKAGLHGSLELPGLDSKLDMQLPGVKLFALELAALQASAQQLLAKLKAQPAEELDKVLALYESTFVGLQAMGSHFPKGSAELQAAEEALMAVLSKLVTELKGVYGNNMLYQVAFLGDAPVSSGDASHLMEWKEVSRRVLLRRAVEGDGLSLLADDEGASSKRYAEKATAYGVTLILIWFTFAGVYCMVAMPFKQDTLLYGRTKTD